MCRRPLCFFPILRLVFLVDLLAPIVSDRPAFIQNNCQNPHSWWPSRFSSALDVRTCVGCLVGSHLHTAIYIYIYNISHSSNRMELFFPIVFFFFPAFLFLFFAVFLRYTYKCIFLSSPFTLYHRGAALFSLFLGDVLRSSFVDFQCERHHVLLFFSYFCRYNYFSSINCSHTFDCVPFLTRLSKWLFSCLETFTVSNDLSEIV